MRFEEPTDCIVFDKFTRHLPVHECVYRSASLSSDESILLLTKMTSSCAAFVNLKQKINITTTSHSNKTDINRLRALLQRNRLRARDGGAEKKDARRRRGVGENENRGRNTAGARPWQGMTSTFSRGIHNFFSHFFIIRYFVFVPSVFGLFFSSSSSSA